ncbi:MULTISPECIES: hypothetical protein [Staphylococcus]|uniref:Phage protein n=1 Tax=Staphylococcus agnetis TaxID=985762 RepID=A0AAW9YTP8_9STAP|nr:MULTISPECIES: hypothetical protein [Staphylococcus]NHM91455.1 hypothetical protein [Staphylococcus sp. 10602379]NJI03077.1 hypothetical protein [Staphylococcus agnetis]
MEQITLTKQELIEIVEREVSKRLDGKKPISSGAIFNKVRISHKDFDEINKKFAYTERLRGANNLGLGHPLSLKKYQHGLGCYEHYKTYASDIHDHIRKLTLSAFGVTLNSDLSEKEYEEAARIYELIKTFYLYQYQKRIETLSIEDFE